MDRVLCVQGSWGTSESEAFAEKSRSGAFGPNSKIVRHIDDITNNYNLQLTALLDMVRARAEGCVLFRDSCLA